MPLGRVRNAVGPWVIASQAKGYRSTTDVAIPGPIAPIYYHGFHEQLKRAKKATDASTRHPKNGSPPHPDFLGCTRN